MNRERVEVRAYILAQLEPMKRRARAEGLVFETTSFIHSGLRLTVDELERANQDGRFIWGPVNWRLVKDRRKQKS